jgi:polysaccharide chain length determinant protein (PEP-CTERM system associated)
LLPDRYESSARVYVDTQSILKPLMSGLAVQPNVDQQINILSRTLISRPNVEKLIRMADLDLAVKTKEEREALDRQRHQVSCRSVLPGRDNLYTLAYTDTDAERAKRVVQSMVSMFVESGLGDKRKDSDTARKFIEEQIKAYEQKLEDAENRLKEYKLRNHSHGRLGRSGLFPEDDRSRRAAQSGASSPCVKLKTRGMRSSGSSPGEEPISCRRTHVQRCLGCRFCA